MNIITGYRGEPHITEQQDRDINRGIFGDAACIVDIGSMLEAATVSATEIQIADGLLIAEGCAAEVPYGTVESLSIENGTQGMLRNDLIVARYTRDAGTGVEDMQLAVLTGTPAVASPADPAYTSGSIAAGDSLVEFPLYRVSINGITISSVTRLVGQSAIAKLISKVGSASLGTAATTITGAIRELHDQITNLTAEISSRFGSTAITQKYIDSSGTGNYQLSASYSGVLFVGAASQSDSVKGVYIISVTGGNTPTLTVTAVKTASDVQVYASGTKLMIRNRFSGAGLRCALLTTSGSRPAA